MRRASLITRLWLSGALSLALSGTAALAESLVAARNLPAHSLISAADLQLVAAAMPGALTRAEDAIGFETRIAIYAGRAIRNQDLGPPALIERNALVGLQYRAGGLVIRAEGRALARAGAGETIRVMNIASKTTVTGLVGPDGLVHVGEMP